MSQLLIFGLGYTASALALRLRARGWQVTATTRDGREGTLRFEDEGAVFSALRSASHILSSVPPDVDGAEPVLDRYGEAIALSSAQWVGYLSSTGVYGDTGGAWVDESAPLHGRRGARNAADIAWSALRDNVRLFRLPGIYGPGRSALDRVMAGKAHRTRLQNQIFSRIHVDDIVGAILASFGSAATGAFNIADDLPASQDLVVAHAAALLNAPPPPIVSLDALSPMARAFYAENRRVSNGRAKRLLSWTLRYPTYREGLSAIVTGMRS